MLILMKPGRQMNGKRRFADTIVFPSRGQHKMAWLELLERFLTPLFSAPLFSSTLADSRKMPHLFGVPIRLREKTLQASVDIR